MQNSALWNSITSGDPYNKVEECLRKEIHVKSSGAKRLGKGAARFVVHAAAARGNVQILKLLLELEPSLKTHLNSKDEIGWLPVHHAIANGNVVAVQFLLSLSSEIPQDLADRLSNAKEQKATEKDTKASQEDLVQTLLEKAAGMSDESKGRHCDGEAETSGVLYAWGDGSTHVLGHGDSGRREQPKRIASLSNESILDFDISKFRAACCTTKGDLYTWGMNGEGFLGRLSEKVNETVLVPRRVYLKGKSVTGVAVGKNHMAFVTGAGQVYAFGDNRYGQLGFGELNAREPLKGKYSRRLLKEPRRVRTSVLESARARHVAAGSFHTVLLDDEGRMFTFGLGTSGQLGYLAGKDTGGCQSTPRQVIVSSPVTKIAASGNVTVCASGTNNVYFYAEPCDDASLPRVSFPSLLGSGKEAEDSARKRKEQERKGFVLTTAARKIRVIDVCAGGHLGAAIIQEEKPGLSPKRGIFIFGQKERKPRQRGGTAGGNTRRWRDYTVKARAFSPPVDSVVHVAVSGDSDLGAITSAGELWVLQSHHLRSSGDSGKKRNHHKTVHGGTSGRWTRVGLNHVQKALITRSQFMALVSKPLIIHPVKIQRDTLRLNLYKQVNDKLFADVRFSFSASLELSLDDDYVYAHRSMLAARSPVFNAFFWTVRELKRPAKQQCQRPRTSSRENFKDKTEEEQDSGTAVTCEASAALVAPSGGAKDKEEVGSDHMAATSTGANSCSERTFGRGRSISATRLRRSGGARVAASSTDPEKLAKELLASWSVTYGDASGTLPVPCLTVIILEEGISRASFLEFIEFLYTDYLLAIPRSREHIASLKYLSKALMVPSLAHSLNELKRREPKKAKKNKDKSRADQNAKTTTAPGTKTNKDMVQEELITAGDSRHLLDDISRGLLDSSVALTDSARFTAFDMQLTSPADSAESVLAVNCHRFVVAERSEIFQAMLSARWSSRFGGGSSCLNSEERSQGEFSPKEGKHFGRCDPSLVTIEVPVSSPVILQLLRQYLYLGRMEGELAESVLGSASVCLELLSIANAYLLERLKNLCEERLSGLVGMRNVVSMLQNAELYRADQLKQACAVFINTYLPLSPFLTAALCRHLSDNTALLQDVEDAIKTVRGLPLVSKEYITENTKHNSNNSRRSQNGASDSLSLPSQLSSLPLALRRAETSTGEGTEETGNKLPLSSRQSGERVTPESTISTTAVEKEKLPLMHDDNNIAGGAPHKGRGTGDKLLADGYTPKAALYSRSSAPPPQTHKDSGPETAAAAIEVDVALLVSFANLSVLTEKERKRVRALRKKLNQIDKLEKQRRTAGARPLSREQVEKCHRRPEIEQELMQLAESAGYTVSQLQDMHKQSLSVISTATGSAGTQRATVTSGSSGTSSSVPSPGTFTASGLEQEGPFIKSDQLALALVASVVEAEPLSQSSAGAGSSSSCSQGPKRRRRRRKNQSSSTMQGASGEEIPVQKSSTWTGWENILATPEIVASSSSTVSSFPPKKLSLSQIMAKEMLEKKKKEQQHKKQQLHATGKKKKQSITSATADRSPRRPSGNPWRISQRGPPTVEGQRANKSGRTKAVSTHGARVNANGNSAKQNKKPVSLKEIQQQQLKASQQRKDKQRKATAVGIRRQPPSNSTAATNKTGPVWGSPPVATHVAVSSASRRAQRNKGPGEIQHQNARARSELESRDHRKRPSARSSTALPRAKSTPFPVVPPGQVRSFREILEEEEKIDTANKRVRQRMRQKPPSLKFIQEEEMALKQIHKYYESHLEEKVPEDLFWG